MILIVNKHVVFSILALTQSSVFASSYDVDDKPEAMAKRMIEFATLPWGEGLDWILHDSNSPRREEVKKIVRGIESGEIWALEVMDILLRIQRKIRKKSIQDVEVQNQCIAPNAPYNHSNIRDANCPRISLDNVFGITGRSGGLPLSVCNRSSKVKSPVVQIENDIIESEPLIGEIDLGATNSPFVPPKSKDFTSVEISAIIFFSGVGAFMIACTICDIVRRSSSTGNLTTTVNTLSKFSLYTNALSILDTRVTPDMMPAIHGIRCLGFCTILIAHHFSLATFVMREKLTELDILEWKTSWIILCLQMVPYVVDTFFVISGFLAIRLFSKSIRSGIRINSPMVYIYRYLRITRCLVIVMLFATVLLHRAGSGPLWTDMVTRLNNQCRESWWIHFLYAQNLVENGILVTTNMQLFCMSPVILYPLHKWPRVGLGVLSLCLVASVVTPAITLAINGYSNTFLRFDVDSSRILENFLNYYTATYNHPCPYLVGTLLGYEVAKKKRHLTQINVAINWLIAGSLILFCIWATNWAYNFNFAYDLRMEIAFAALLRPSWSIAMAWIIYACTQGYGGLATRFLSLPLFFPPSRLAYCIYLVHAGIQAIAIDPSESSPNYFGFGMFYRICGDLVMSIALAFIFNLFIESPAIVLVKILTNTTNQPEQATVVQESKKNQEFIIQR